MNGQIIRTGKAPGKTVTILLVFALLILTLLPLFQPSKHAPNLRPNGITIIAAPPSLTITSVNPNPANTGETINVTYSINNPATIAQITVDWGDGTVTNPAASSTSDTHVYRTTQYSLSNTYAINVTAITSAGRATATTTVTINDRPPLLATTNLEPHPPIAGQQVRLEFNATDPDGLVTATWVDWGDGSKPDLIFNMTSGSMCQRYGSCVIAPGNLIWAQSQDPSTINSGSIIIFRPYPQIPDFLVVHRVIKVMYPSQSTGDQYTFWTKGDANAVQDSWTLQGSQVVAVYGETLTPMSTSSQRYDFHTYPGTANSPSKTYIVHLNATDDSGSHSYQTATITVNPQPSSPVPTPTIFGLAPITFFAMVGSIIIAVIATTVIFRRLGRVEIQP